MVLLQLLVTEAGAKLREGQGGSEAGHCLPAPAPEDRNLYTSGPHPAPASAAPTEATEEGPGC